MEGQLILISANSPRASERPRAGAAAAAEPLCLQQVGRGARPSPGDSWGQPLRWTPLINGVHAQPLNVISFNTVLNSGRLALLIG